MGAAMRERDDMPDASLGRVRPILVGVGLTLAVVISACSSAGGAPSAPPAAAEPTRASVAPSSAATAAPSSRPATPSPSTAAASPEASVPILDPVHCPATLPPADERTPDGMDLEGDAAFIAHVKEALALLASKAPESYAAVRTSVTRIRSVPSFSGMCYDTGTYRVGEQTAYAPGYPPEQQVVWLAGTIVHDGCHRDRFVQGLDPSGRDAELACLEVQLVALKQIDEPGRFRDYVQDLIDTVDDPDSQYWTAENRHW
jgi:hypothetical protein